MATDEYVSRAELLRQRERRLWWESLSPEQQERMEQTGERLAASLRETPPPEPLDRETLWLAAVNAEKVLGPKHSATRAFARAAETMAPPDLYNAKLAVKRLPRHIREEIGE